MGTRSAIASLVKDYRPSDMMELSNLVFRLLEEIRVDNANRVVAGGLAKDPTTPSSQATGTGNTAWLINLDAVVVVVDGVMKEFAAQTDVVIHSGSYLTGFASGKSCKAAVVAKLDGSTVTIETVKGTAATTGSEVGPTDAVIQAAMGAGKSWVKLAEDTLNRTGDLTVTQAHDNTARPVLGVTAGFELDF